MKLIMRLVWGRKARDVFDECVPEYFGTRRNMRVNIQGNWGNK